MSGQYELNHSERGTWARYFDAGSVACLWPNGSAHIGTERGESSVSLWNHSGDIDLLIATYEATVSTLMWPGKTAAEWSEVFAELRARLDALQQRGADA